MSVCEHYKNDFVGISPGSSCADCFMDVQDWSEVRTSGDGLVVGVCTQCVKAFPMRGEWKCCGDHCKLCKYSRPHLVEMLKQEIKWAKDMGRSDEIPKGVFEDLKIAEACTFIRNGGGEQHE